MGRLTRDPEVIHAQNENATTISKYSLAVQKRFKREGDADADFINCVAFGRQAEFAEKYFKQGMRICISGRIQTGSYVNRDGVKVYTTDVVVEEQDFCESKRDNPEDRPAAPGFMNIPDSLEEELPFA